ncbi:MULTISPECIES: MFS transporter [unclassified Cryobacterium]|uniref:MFS transporter n=2 Tax=Cryobacterium TaxID=69578 RepID=UPI002AB4F142|nr:MULTISPECIES: MFS transporter [unclassified Cryobacterium]MDY7529578.1 MFS transporter [Cryobacterium sp. 10C2]MEB0004038.1 MFS transporter [Cryobacterium sp. RTC2.1]MEB0285370.1 MFS transporter [Cryobacterium sp. 10S3]MEB0290116.1 MFS transporter [Cryobacterium sp. 10C2]WPX13377.1 MFS transporter [Cryobacterium sp. 10S3]
MTAPSEPTDASAPSPGSPNGRGTLAWRNAVFAVFFISGLGLASWVARIPAVRDSLRLDTALVGVLIFGLSAGSVLGLVVAVRLLARFGAPRAMTISVATSSIGLVVVGAGATLLGSAPVVFAGLAAVGLGMGSLDVMMNVEGAAAERAIRKTLMPLMHACFSLGTVVGALLGAAASALSVSVFWHLTAIAVLVFLIAVLAVRSIPELENAAETSAPGEPASTWRSRLRASLSVWADPGVLLIGAIVLGMTFAEGSANDWIALASVDGHGFSNTAGAIVFGVFVAAMTVGRVIGGPVIDRFGRVPVLRACAVIGVLGLLLFILAPNDFALYAGTVLWGVGASLGFPVGMSAAADDTRNSAARVSAVAMIGYFAFLVGPPVLGLLGQNWGILNALYLIVALMALAGLAAPAARERHRR